MIEYSGYLLDTNILIGMKNNYPATVFPTLWDFIGASMNSGITLTCHAVVKELTVKNRADDGLTDYLDQHNCLILEESEKILAHAGNIVFEHAGWIKGTKNEADPLLIATAIEHRLIVVTDERKTRSTVAGNLKIPNVASRYGVLTFNFIEYLQHMGFSS